MEVHKFMMVFQNFLSLRNKIILVVHTLQDKVRYK